LPGRDPAQCPTGRVSDSQAWQSTVDMTGIAGIAGTTGRVTIVETDG
jgi:hypothetical protein